MADYQRWVLLRRIQLAPPGARDDDRVLGEPLQRPGQRRRPVHLARRLTATSSAPTRSAGSTSCCRRRSPHPAMLICLDNVSSTKPHPNENLGRELLELHTVGRGNYDEDDVKALRADPHRLDRRHVEDLRAAYDEDAARPRPREGDGLPATANTQRRRPRRSPATTSPTSPTTRRPPSGSRRKLAVKFVRDDPPPRARQPARPGLPRPRHRRSGRCCGRWSVARSSGGRSAPRCATPARTSSRRTAPSASGPPATRRRRGDELRRQPDALAGRRPGHHAVRLAAARRPADRQRRRGRRPRG